MLLFVDALARMAVDKPLRKDALQTGKAQIGITCTVGRIEQWPDVPRLCRQREKAFHDAKIRIGENALHEIREAV